MYADKRDAGRKSYPKEARGRVDRPPTLGDSQRKNRRRDGRRKTKQALDRGDSDRSAANLRECIDATRKAWSQTFKHLDLPSICEDHGQNMRSATPRARQNHAAVTPRRTVIQPAHGRGRVSTQSTSDLLQRPPQAVTTRRTLIQPAHENGVTSGILGPTSSEADSEVALAPIEPHREREAETGDQRALVVYQPPRLPCITTMTAPAGNTYWVPLPYLGEPVTISLDVMLFLDALLLSGAHVTRAVKQLHLTYSEADFVRCRCFTAGAAPVPAPSPTSQQAQPSFDRLATIMDAAWFGSATQSAAPSAQPGSGCHTPPQASPKKQKRQGGILGFTKALLRPCFGHHAPGNTSL